MKNKYILPYEQTVVAEPPHKQYKYLYRQMLQKDTIERAWHNLRKGKTKRNTVKYIDAHLDEEIAKMQVRIENTKPAGYYVEHPELAYEPPKIRQTKIVNEHGKRRVAHLANIREQWYFHIIVEVLQPIVMKKIYPYSCGSIPGRGPHSGKRYLERAIKNNCNVRYFLKADIRHFYDNLRIDVVIKEMRKDIADDLFLYCIAKIYRYVKKGVLIGLYISPWLANYVLMKLDAVIVNIPRTVYVRYMDDIVVFASAKKVLKALLIKIQRELGRLRLKLKHNYQICKFDYRGKGRALDFMGFLFFRNRTVMRKSVMISATRSARKLYKSINQGRKYRIKAVRGLISKMGWFKHTDSYNCYLAHIKPFVKIKILKNIVARRDRKECKNDRLENRVLCHAT